MPDSIRVGTLLSSDRRYPADGDGGTGPISLIINKGEFETEQGPATIPPNEYCNLAQ